MNSNPEEETTTLSDVQLLPSSVNTHLQSRLSKPKPGAEAKNCAGQKARAVTRWQYLNSGFKDYNLLQLSQTIRETYASTHLPPNSDEHNFTALANNLIVSKPQHNISWEVLLETKYFQNLRMGMRDQEFTELLACVKAEAYGGGKLVQRPGGLVEKFYVVLSGRFTVYYDRLHLKNTLRQVKLLHAVSREKRGKAHQDTSPQKKTIYSFVSRISRRKSSDHQNYNFNLSREVPGPGAISTKESGATLSMISGSGPQTKFVNSEGAAIFTKVLEPGDHFNGEEFIERNYASVRSQFGVQSDEEGGLLVALSKQHFRRYLHKLHQSDILSAAKFFSQFKVLLGTNRQIRELMPLMKEHNLSKNQVLFEKGDPVRFIYFIRSGSVDLANDITQSINAKRAQKRVDLPNESQEYEWEVPLQSLHLTGQDIRVSSQVSAGPEFCGSAGIVVCENHLLGESDILEGNITHRTQARARTERARIYQLDLSLLELYISKEDIAKRLSEIQSHARTESRVAGSRQCSPQLQLLQKFCLTPNLLDSSISECKHITKSISPNYRYQQKSLILPQYSPLDRNALHSRHQSSLGVRQHNQFQTVFRLSRSKNMYLQQKQREQSAEFTKPMFLNEYISRFPLQAQTSRNSPEIRGCVNTMLLQGSQTPAISHKIGPLLSQATSPLHITSRDVGVISYDPKVSLPRAQPGCNSSCNEFKSQPDSPSTHQALNHVALKKIALYRQAKHAGKEGPPPMCQEKINAAHLQDIQGKKMGQFFSEQDQLIQSVKANYLRGQQLSNDPKEFYEFFNRVKLKQSKIKSDRAKSSQCKRNRFFIDPQSPMLLIRECSKHQAEKNTIQVELFQ